MSPRRTAWLVAALMVAISAAAVGWIVNEHYLGYGSGSAGRVLVGGPFTLTAHTGERVAEADYRGKLMLVYFGYTYCPDVCPTELQVISQALDLVGERADEVAPLFITVDPARDTPEVLADYVGYFDDRLIGLSGTEEEIAAVAKAYRVYYAKVEGEPGDVYLMDHTSLIYLMGRDGEYLRHFTTGTDPQTMADAIGEEL